MVSFVELKFTFLVIKTFLIKNAFVVIAFILPVPCILGTAGTNGLLGGTEYAEKILAAANYPSEEKDALLRPMRDYLFPESKS